MRCSMAGARSKGNGLGSRKACVQQIQRKAGAAAGIEQAVDGQGWRQGGGELAADVALDFGGAVVACSGTLKRLTNARLGRPMH